MFSIPAAGLAKTLIGVTISLHGAPAHHVPGHYTVRPGDTLSDIARQEYGSRAEWPALWWTNRHQISNPNTIAAGQKLRLSTWHPRKAWVERAAMAAAGPALAAAPYRHRLRHTRSRRPACRWRPARTRPRPAA